MKKTMKKGIFLLALALIVAGGVFAQRVGDTVQIAGQTYTILTISGDTIVLQRGGNAPPPVPQGGGTTSTLDGVWSRTAGDNNNPFINNARMRIQGSAATLTDLSGVSTGNNRFRDALNKGIVKVGDQVMRNIRFTGGTSYSCEILYIDGTTNTASSTQWRQATIMANDTTFARYNINVTGFGSVGDFTKR